MYENNSNHTKQIISNYFIQDDNKSLYSLINNLKASHNSNQIDILMDSFSNISKEKSISSKLSTVSNSNFNELMKKRRRSEKNKINKREKFITDFHFMYENNNENIQKNEKTKYDKHNRSCRRKPDEIKDKLNNKNENISTFDEIFKYKQFYIDDEKFLSKNDFLKNKNDYNLFSKDNIFSINQIKNDQAEINKKTRENRSLVKALLSNCPSSVSSILSNKNYLDYNINLQKIKNFNLDFNNKLSLREKKN